MPAAFAAGLAVGLLSALAGIGGGVLMVPFLYLVYAPSGQTLSAQTVVAHATSLGVAFLTSLIGTWRYALTRAIVWRAALYWAAPAIVSAFLTARLLTRLDAAPWIRAVFGCFLLASAVDMARRGLRRSPEPTRPREHSWGWLLLLGAGGGALSALLGIGGGLIAVPVFLYVAGLPVKSVAPTALASVCLTTLAGGLGYLSAGAAPPVSSMMVGFVDLRMLLPLSLGAVITVPLGVRINRVSSSATLYWMFAVIFLVLGAAVLASWARG